MHCEGIRKMTAADHTRHQPDPSLPLGDHAAESIVIAATIYADGDKERRVLGADLRNTSDRPQTVLFGIDPK